MILILWAAGAGPPVRRSSVDSLLRQLTLEEKLTLVHGARDPNRLGQAGYWPGVPRLGIPPLRLADGPAGVNVNADASAMPAPVGLAATFNTEAARLYGVVLGREAKALRQDIILAPYVNIVRDPLFRRNHTTLGEDPLLNARIAASEIDGIQSRGVMAQVKHAAGYSGFDNVVIDEQALHEIYLPAFEAAAKVGVASVMCAYNQINGAWACENSTLLNDILRGRWRFQGFVTSDWGAVHSPLAITKGLDLEMPGRLIENRSGPHFTDALKAAIENGAVSVSAVDTAVERILRQMERFSLLGKKQRAHRARIDAGADANIIREIAEQGAVLLKNEAEALPLTSGDLASLAVIGPTAGQLAAGCMGERAYGFESRLVSPFAALRKLAPGARITYSVGNDLTGAALTAPVVLAPGAPFKWSKTLPLSSDGDYTFMIQVATAPGAAGSAEVLVDGRTVLRTGGFRGFGIVEREWSSLLPTTDGRDNSRATVHLPAGDHRVEISATSEGRAPWDIRFAWMTPELRRGNIETAVRAAKAARTAIVFAWSETGNSLALPEDQDELIRAVAAANPRTSIVLNTGGPVSMPWKDNVRAIFQMWYPGQEGGWATARLLLGRSNPGGKLPVTFPVRIDDAPARAAGHPERWAAPAPPGRTGLDTQAPVVIFSEGIAVGYRWYDQQGIEPLFAFGHGLSYTRFEYSDLTLRPSRGGIDVAFTLRNTGSRRGAEVAQVYVGPAEPLPAPMAKASLAGFQRIVIEPGKSRRVTIHVDRRALSYWSTDKHDWVFAGASRPIYVGSASRDIRLKGSLPATIPGSS